MFTKGYNDEIKMYFNTQMALLQNRKRQLKQENEKYAEENEFFCLSQSFLDEKIIEISRTLEECSEEEAEALRFLYSSMPVSDMVDYPAGVFLAYARHAVFLWNEGPYAGKIPEKIFANYVLHHRINHEDMTDTRAFFYEKLIKGIAGMTMEEAVMEANVWCAEEATYRMTDRRDESPITMYRTGIGRCGEESTFAITVLRSLGIPARQVYVPLWSHCDSNHAWVEAWCDGKWRIFGACEPEEKLDMGWFMGPSTRAMQVHSIWFGKDRPLDQVVGQRGMSVVVNHLDNYAKKGELKVRVQKENGELVPGARVEFNVLNGSFFGSVASLTTGSTPEKDLGEVTLFSGFGSLLVCAYADGLYGEKLVRLNRESESGDATTGVATETTTENATGTTGETATGNTTENATETTTEVITETIVVIKEGLPQLNEWRDITFYSPREAVRDEQVTEEQIEAQNTRLRDQAKKRQEKTDGFYCKWKGERVLGCFPAKDRDEVKAILLKSYGNMDEIVRFLDMDFTGLLPELYQGSDRGHWKLEVLRQLGEKDYWDITADVLADSCICASPYAKEYPADVFYPFLLAPRVADEMLRPYRQAILKCISLRCQEEIRKSPEILPKKLKQFMISMPEQEYGGLITSPIGCFTGGIGNKISQAVLCVKMYRALGIPARLRTMDRAVEYYKDGAFQTAFKEEISAAGEGDKAKLVLHGKDGMKFSDWEHYSVSRFKDGRFNFLFLGGPDMPKGDTLEADLEPGIYRAVTSNRLPTGDQFVRVCDFTLSEKEEKHLDMELRDYPVNALLSNYSIKDCAVETIDGKVETVSALAGERRSAFFWLQTGKEPSEHVLNELLDKKDQIMQLNKTIHLIVGDVGDYEENATLKRVAEELPVLKLLACGSAESYQALSESVEQCFGRLPMVFVMHGKNRCIYSDGGYNVGMVDLVLRVLTDE